jgi:hypothetical protein
MVSVARAALHNAWIVGQELLMLSINQSGLAQSSGARGIERFECIAVAGRRAIETPRSRAGGQAGSRDRDFTAAPAGPRDAEAKEERSTPRPGRGGHAHGAAHEMRPRM